MAQVLDPAAQMQEAQQKAANLQIREQGAAQEPAGTATTTPEHATGAENEASIEQLNNIIKACRTCMLTTHGEHGLHARPMSTAAIDFDTHKGEAIYFVTEKSTAKVAEIQSNQDVALVFSDDANNRWASVTARATVIEDREKTKELWSQTYNAWFPEGPETPGVVLVKAVPSCGSYWEGSHLTRLHILFSALSARVTGKPIDQRKTQDAKSVVFPQPSETSGTPSTTVA